MPAGWDWAHNDRLSDTFLSGVFNNIIVSESRLSFLLLRIDDIEDNSKLRRGIPGDVGWNVQTYKQTETEYLFSQVLQKNNKQKKKKNEAHKVFSDTIYI